MIEELILFSIYAFSGFLPIIYNYVIAKRIARRCYEIKPYIQPTIDNNIQIVSNDALKTLGRADLNSGLRDSIFKVDSISTTSNGISLNLVIDRERLMDLLKKS